MEIYVQDRISQSIWQKYSLGHNYFLIVDRQSRSIDKYHSFVQISILKLSSKRDGIFFENGCSDSL